MKKQIEEKIVNENSSNIIQSPQVETIQSHKIFKRNVDGLINGLEYHYLDDGKINWRKMLKSEHVTVFREKKEEVENKYGKNIEELDLTQVEDKYLLLLLSGIRYLCSIRGAISVKPQVVEANSNRCVVQTSIKWIPNFETNNLIVEYGDVGAASIENTYSFGQRYLEACATNRAFVRAVRNFLGINIVAYDEVGPTPKNKNESENESSIPGGYKPCNLLEQKVDSLGLSFDKFKEGITSRYKDKIKSEPEKWTSYSDIPSKDIYVLLSIMEDAKKK